MTAALICITEQAHHYLKGETGIIPLQAESVRSMRCGGSSSFIYIYDPSFENEKFLQERYDMARRIQDKTKVYDARGTAKVLTKRIGNKYGY